MPYTSPDIVTPFSGKVADPVVLEPTEIHLEIIRTWFGMDVEMNDIKDLKSGADGWFMFSLRGKNARCQNHACPEWLEPNLASTESFGVEILTARVANSVTTFQGMGGMFG